jgi:hypothetical protein
VSTYEKLDRVLASVEWEQKYPLVIVRALTRTSSDHTPLLLDSGEQDHLGYGVQSMLFNYLLVQILWKSGIIRSSTSVVFLRGWAKKLSSVYKKKWKDFFLSSML